MEAIKIMLVEDDKILSEQLKLYLSRWGYDVETSRHFENIVNDFEKIRPWLILMDINLPLYDGFYWCNQIREISKVPIIFISSRSDDQDKVMAITQGGDDYIEKPFQLIFLKAKIEALLRRTYQYKSEQKVFLMPHVIYDNSTSSLYCSDKKIELTKSENIILRVLSQSRPHIVSRSQLMDALWSTDEFISDNTLTVLISRLRAKIKECCQAELIQTKKGQGYYIE